MLKRSKEQINYNLQFEQATKANEISVFIELKDFR
jgi:hypothetical protein